MSKKYRFTKSIFVCLLSAVIFFTAVYSPYIQVQASSDDQNSPARKFQEKFYELTNRATGFILSPIAGVKDSFTEWLGTHKENYGGTSEQSTDDFINQNFTYDTQNYTIGQNLVNSMRDFNQYYINNNSDILYGYSYAMEDIMSFIDIDTYNLFYALMEEYPNDLFSLASAGNTAYLNHWSGVTDYVLNYKSEYNQLICSFYSNGSQTIPSVTTYYRPSSSSVLTSTTYTNTTADPKTFAILPNSSPIYNVNGIVVDLASFQYVIYYNSNDIPSEDTGIQDYYISDSYNTSHIDNSMVLSISEVDNSVTYNDVNTYIDTFRDTNNRVPTSTEIYIYINNYDGSDPSPTPTPTPTPGPGGGGDDDEEESESGFFELIKKVLDFVAKLFDTIAGFLADLVDSLGDIVNAVLENILSLITNITENIPHAMSDLLSYFFDFLPEEVIALIELAISCMVIIGIIRLIRGS